MTPISDLDRHCRCGCRCRRKAMIEAEEQALLEDDPAYYYDKGGRADVSTTGAGRAQNVTGSRGGQA